MLQLWETLCRQLWLSGWLPWAPQGLMCWYLMALSSGAWYLTSPFYSISTWFFFFPHDLQLTTFNSALSTVTPSRGLLLLARYPVILHFQFSYPLFRSLRQDGRLCYYNSSPATSELRLFCPPLVTPNVHFLFLLLNWNLFLYDFLALTFCWLS